MGTLVVRSGSSKIVRRGQIGKCQQILHETATSLRRISSPLMEKHRGLRLGVMISGHSLDAHPPAPLVSTTLSTLKLWQPLKPLPSLAQATGVGRKWNLPPTGAAKQHPTPTAQAGTRRSSCPGTVCNREARGARGWQGGTGRRDVSKTRVGVRNCKGIRAAQEGHQGELTEDQPRGLAG